jgi:Flp pilus assembly protein TadB
MSQPTPSPKRLPAAAIAGVGGPLAVVWVVLLLTGAVDSGTLIGLAIAIVILVVFVSVRASHRMKRGR